jgi:RNA:NAD 2''-phosphotransferase
MGFDKVTYDVKRNIFIIGFMLDDDNKRRYELLNNFLNNVCGWIHGSTIVNRGIISNKLDFLNLTTGIVSLQYEAKFDIKIEKLPNILYHLTVEDKLNKILKNGLTPKSSTQFFSFKDRIYLSTNLESLIDLAQQKNYIIGGRKFILLQINGLSLNDGIRFFKDPNFENGVYTLENISPLLIKPINKLIFDDMGSYKIEDLF